MFQLRQYVYQRGVERRVEQGQIMMVKYRHGDIIL
jgi:hypothetical protein